jgi:hypothetical protein
MKRLIYQVNLGRQRKSKLYKACIESVAKYCKEHGIDHVVQTEPILMIKPDPFGGNRSAESYEKHGGFLPIFEKENAFTYFKDYDQVAVIDADIWIRPGSPNVFDEINPESDFAGVLERDQPSLPWHRQKLPGYSRMQYGSIRNVDWNYTKDGVAEFFNMGMMVMNKSITRYLNGETPQQFLRRPRFKPFVDGQGPWKWSTDQTLLNTWVQEENMNLTYLDWKWNALYTAIPQDKIREAYFVHFFLKDKLPGGGENVEQLMKDVVR